MKEYTKQVCPQCYEVVDPIGNPMNMYVHDKKEGGCGYIGSTDDPITVADTELIGKEISHLESLVERFPSLKSFEDKK